MVSAVIVGLRAAPDQRPAGSSSGARVYVKDAFVRDAVTLAIDAAAERLQTAKCQSLLSEFRDTHGRPLRENLSTLDVTVLEYLRLLVFTDGETHPRCKEEGVLAFTATASRVIYVCGPAFRRGFKRDVTVVRATIIHELLHSLGLGENPPTPQQINDRVNRLCW